MSEPSLNLALEQLINVLFVIINCLSIFSVGGRH